MEVITGWNGGSEIRYSAALALALSPQCPWRLTQIVCTKINLGAVDLSHNMLIST
jgi:hypothetical protein